MLDLYRTFQNGKLTEEDLIGEMITNLGGSLYVYMVMLANAERTSEAKRMEDWRTRIFAVRSAFSVYGSQRTLEGMIAAAADLEVLTKEMTILKDMLYVYRPEECQLFQSPLNSAIGILHVLREYIKKQT